MHLQNVIDVVLKMIEQNQGTGLVDYHVMLKH